MLMSGDETPSNVVVFVDDADRALEETMALVPAVLDDDGTAMFGRLFADVRAIFEGQYPGYRASNTRYHDFGHTASVVLATARLFHGCKVDGLSFSPKRILLTLIAAFFHDTGLIQTENDRHGSGAKYTVGHEERSVGFFRKYLAGKDFLENEIENGANFIRCTILDRLPLSIPFPDEESRTCGYILGSADLLAQMADRLYLEKLLLLFKEFEEARLPGFDSELDLLHKTKDFYTLIAEKRLNKDLGGVRAFMRAHFRQWFNLDADVYSEAISKTIRYLEMVIDYCQDSFDCYLEYLRRGGIAGQIKAERARKRKK
jgi:hypothetical protein